MQEPHLIWRLATWFREREGGAARLTWSDGEIILRISEGRVRSIEGVDTGELANRLECDPIGCSDLLEEAHVLSTQREVPETQATGTAKELMQRALHQWMLDPERELEVVEGTLDDNDNPSISITHAVVELVLSDVEHGVTDQILPDRDVLLRRVPGFLELYAPLRLSEDADLVVAKVSGERTADEIAFGSPHGESEVLRLLAALVATGMLEAVPVPTAAGDVEVLPADFEDEEIPRRKLPVLWILVAVAVIVVILGYLGYRMRTSSTPPVETEVATSQGHHWALVVDMGCEPEELQRILRKARENPKTLQPVAADDPESGQPCWRLTWGNFDSQPAAEAEIQKIPPSVMLEGFAPHAIEVPDDAAGLEPNLAQD